MKLYFLLSNTGTVLSRTIKIFTRYPYNHVSFGFSEDLKSLYSFGRKNPRNPFSGGFVIENIYEGLYEIKKDTVCRVLSLEVTDEQQEKLKKVIEDFSDKKEIYKYNTLGLIRNALGTPDDKKKHEYFCSEFVAKMMRKSGIYDFKKSDELVRPQDFVQIEGAEITYEGLLREYYKK